MRITLAAGLLSAITLVGLLHAPVVPVVIGAVGACAWLSWRLQPTGGSS